VTRSYGLRRARGEGAVYKAKDGRWRACLVISHPDTGATTRRFVSGRTRADAVRALEKLRKAVGDGFADGRTVGEYLTVWVEKVKPGLRTSSHREHSRHVLTYLRPLHAIELAKLTPAHVERALAGLLEGGLSANTVRGTRTSLRRALHDAQRDGLVARNAAALARPPRVERREMVALSADEVRRLLADTADDDMGPLWALAVGSGLRRGELLALRWSDIDADAGTLVVRRTLALAEGGGFEMTAPKTPRSRRTVNLPAFARDALRHQKARQAALRLAAGKAWQDRDGLVFTDEVGRPVDPNTVSSRFHRVALRLGLPVGLHGLRHTAATLMLQAGVPLKVVSDALGHSTISITADVYSHVTPDLRREAASALDRALGS